VAKDKKKKSIFKRWWFWVLAIIVIIAIASGGESDDTTQSTDKEESTKAESASASKETKTTDSDSAKEEKSFSMNEEVKVGKMTYKVTSKTTADQVGPSALPDKANQKFVVVELTIKNGGDDAVTVDSTFFKLKRAGKTYEADAMASMSANQDESGNITNSFFAQKLNPDSEMSGKVVFDVAPEVANASDLQLQVQTGAFGTETELINLK
jgi:hypothetical protein